MNAIQKNESEYNKLKLLEAEFQEKLNNYSVLSQQLNNNLMGYYGESKKNKNKKITRKTRKNKQNSNKNKMKH